MGADRVLIVGVSTWALALSACEAGYECVSVDAFGDLDQKERVVNVALVRDLGRAWSTETAVAVGRRFEVEGAAYVGSLRTTRPRYAAGPGAGPVVSSSERGHGAGAHRRLGPGSRGRRRARFRRARVSERLHPRRPRLRPGSRGGRRGP